MPFWRGIPEFYESLSNKMSQIKSSWEIDNNLSMFVTSAHKKTERYNKYLNSALEPLK